jgi:mycothiol synthase
MNVGLPKGYTERAAKIDDMQAAVKLWNADSKATFGIEKYHLRDAERDWNTPGFNPETDIRLVFGPQGELSGYCEAWDLNQPHVVVYCWGCTHPQHVGLGIGSHLVKWAEQRSREAILKAPSDARVSMMFYVLSSNKRAAQLFEENGFELVRNSWRMVIDLDQHPPAPQWPEGIFPRQFVMGQDERAAFAAGREAFNDHWGHVERPFEEAFQQWMHRMNSDDDFDPSLFTLAMDGEEIAGVCHCRKEAHDDPQTGWVSSLSVRRPWRKRGLGLALLHNAFVEFYRRGIKRASLGVDAQNLTGAVRLYEKAGMHSDPNWKYSMYEKELRPGVELRKT